MSTLHLDAVYKGPQGNRTFQHPIPLDPTSDTATTKKTHLAALQSLVPKLQDEINVFLTERMEEEKKAQGQVVSEKEAKEEENYGEEVVEDDA
ncbi:hypothetical protein N7510_006877 [Penicillium lagena]|uniref:uncharacterized protein n=1 Tax=Penicillium lagena TaxID=94218 RepID=UPI00253FDF0B|nr:uncharacterized protein N7510_006877 [Penicillium lagena]KAJ5610158.1 hypothetical protein N7510_006877 [Penicillium lagena]